MVLVDMHSTPDQPWDYYPRTTLRRIATKLEEEFGLVVSTDFEREYYLLRREDNNNWIAIDSTLYCSAAAFDGASLVLLEVLKALQSMHIFVEKLHTEAGDGQFEVVLGYSSCVCVADILVFLRESVRAMATKRSLCAALFPKYFLIARYI
ncbi:hypothetical protein SUGI_0225080 [Cryptomeria japonica]|nr:hypothetical protein SUGI_0225080 [Cryptomeria japonica]